MIFAAGLGTRLHPLTHDTPKALIEIGGTTLLERLLHRMRSFGINDVIINLHHHPYKIRNFLHSKNFPGMRIAFSDETEQLLDTGGGLMKAAWFFDDGNPFLVHNVDIISEIDFDEMLGDHLQHEALATLAASERQTSRYLLIDEKGILRGWQNTKTGEKIIPGDEGPLTSLAFSGIHILSPEIFSLIPEKGPFSLIKKYLDLTGTGRIRAFKHQADHWYDVGKIDQLKWIEMEILKKEGRK